MSERCQICKLPLPHPWLCFAAGDEPPEPPPCEKCGHPMKDHGAWAFITGPDTEFKYVCPGEKGPPVRIPHGHRLILSEDGSYRTEPLPEPPK